MAGRLWVLGAAAAAVLAGAAGGLAVLRDAGDGKGSSADCAFVVEWEGRTWVDYFRNDRTPVAGEVLGQGVAPGCDDMGDGPGPSRDVEVRSVEGVDPREVVLVDGTVLVPEGADRLPQALEDGNEPVRCELDGTVRLVGRWIGVASRREVRFDGDVRPPYRLEFRTADQRVAQGWAEVALVARGTADSRPLTPADVEAMLWDDGEEVLSTHCEDGRFVVESIDPGA